MFEFDEFNGKGKLFFNEKNHFYEGEFKNGKISGKGMLFCDEFTYNGSFFEGKMHGKGKIIYKNSEVHFEGEFKYGKKNGFGHFFYKNSFH